jgi:hypothetical protein
MPSRTGRLGLPITAPVTPAAPAHAAPTRASPVAGPLVAAPAALGRLSAEQLIAQVGRYEASSTSNAYALGQILRELSLPKRFRDELGFESFEELLEARSLPSRVTAFKLITVVSTFSDAETQQLGGTEKSYALIRFAKQSGNSDPRRMLAPNARVLGRAVAAISTREINRGLRGEPDASSPEAVAARKASARLGSALRRAGVEHRMRVHSHGQRCVSAHFDAASARQLADALARLRKLEKKAGAPR